MDRREFIKGVTAGAIAVTLAKGRTVMADTNQSKTKVSIVKTTDRKHGIEKAIALLGVNPVQSKNVLIKPNFNTADPFPASTHNDTLVHLVESLRKMGANGITIGERSGPPETGDVINDKGIDNLCKTLGVKLINFEELPAKDWIRITPKGSHWKNGFLVARPVLESECIVSTCCLKTHQYGGVFTMSLKLSVGVTHKENMTELHSSFVNMRKMIAEINLAFKPSLIVMDAIESFVDGGPMNGPKKSAGVIVAGTDRVAIDAVGLAILKDLGSNRSIMQKKIFEQEQIARSVELGIGIGVPSAIELIYDDGSKAYADKINAILQKG